MLLDLSKDINKQFVNIFDNMKDYKVFLEFERYKMVVDIIVSFLKKCRSDQYYSVSRQYFREEQVLSELYLLYLSKMLEKELDLNVQL